MAQEILLKLKDLSRFDNQAKRFLVSKINLEVLNGERIALVGPSGSGKTTLGRLIKGYSSFTEGTIEYCGLSKSSKELLHDKSIQLVFQNPYESFTPHRRVLDLLQEYLIKYQKLSLAKANDAINYYCKSLNVYPSQLKTLPHQLSGGELQRIALMRALLAKPKLLICDEILSALDYPLRLEVLELLLDYQKKMDLTILFITHDLASIARTFNKLIVLKEGRIVEMGNTKEIISLKRDPFVEQSFDALEWLSK